MLSRMHSHILWYLGWVFVISLGIILVGAFIRQRVKSRKDEKDES
jgi:hypothetical protein